MAGHAKVSSLPTGRAELLGPAVAAFLTERDLAPSSHRVYALTLNSLCLPRFVPLSDLRDVRLRAVRMRKRGR